MTDPPEIQSDNTNLSPYAKCARWGAAIGALIPVGFGISRMVEDMVYRASFPPGTPHCGMPMLGAICMIIFVGPIGGLLGAMVGHALGWILKTKFPWLISK